MNIVIFGYEVHALVFAVMSVIVVQVLFPLIGYLMQPGDIDKNTNKVRHDEVQTPDTCDDNSLFSYGCRDADALKQFVMMPDDYK